MCGGGLALADKEGAVGSGSIGVGTLQSRLEVDAEVGKCVWAVRKDVQGVRGLSEECGTE